MDHQPQTEIQKQAADYYSSFINSVGYHIPVAHMNAGQFLMRVAIMLTMYGGSAASIHQRVVGRFPEVNLVDAAYARALVLHRM